VDVRTSLRRRRNAFGRVWPALLLGASLLLSGCPATTVAGKAKPHGEDPGPPSVLNPALLDRG
jgi:hypothetical protein